MLHIVNFRKSFGSLTVLEINDVKIEPGVYWIKGANGSGKTTLLKSIAGILDFDGDVFLYHKTTLKTTPLAYRRLVNFAEAEPIFPDFISGMDLINLFSDAKGATVGQANHYIESMKMWEYVDEPLGTYSSGMLKKLSLVLAFLGRPKLILLDEPLITIDAESLPTINQWIAEKHLRENVSFFLSSHQAVEMNGGFKLRELVVEHKTLLTGF